MRPKTVSFSEFKCCRNCRYFYQHYVKTSSGSFAQCNSGHCDRFNVKMVKRNQVCDAFEERPAEIEERLFPEDELVPDPYDMI